MPKGKKVRYDPGATSGDPDQPGFIARPAGAPVYHGFPLVAETETDGWVYGAITEFETAEPQSEGDGFVVAPDGSRAGIVWATDTPDFYEIVPPDRERWGLWGPLPSPGRLRRRPRCEFPGCAPPAQETPRTGSALAHLSASGPAAHLPLLPGFSVSPVAEAGAASNSAISGCSCA